MRNKKAKSLAVKEKLRSAKFVRKFEFELSLKNKLLAHGWTEEHVTTPTNGNHFGQFSKGGHVADSTFEAWNLQKKFERDEKAVWEKMAAVYLESNGWAQTISGRWTRPHWEKTGFSKALRPEFRSILETYGQNQFFITSLKNAVIQQRKIDVKIAEMEAAKAD